MAMRRAAGAGWQAVRTVDFFLPCASCPAFSSASRANGVPCGKCVCMNHEGTKGFLFLAPFDNISVRESMKNLMRYAEMQASKTKDCTQCVYAK